MALTHKRNAAAIAEATKRKAKQKDAKDDLPVMDAFLLVTNPSNPQQTQQIKNLTRSVESLTRGLVV